MVALGDLAAPTGTRLVRNALGVVYTYVEPGNTYCGCHACTRDMLPRMGSPQPLLTTAVA